MKTVALCGRSKGFGAILVMAMAGGLTLARDSGQGAAGPSQALPVFHAGTDVVQMDVSVLDSRRQPITGLTAGDFTVLEDGRPRQVSVFSFVEIPSAEIPAAAWMQTASPDVVGNQHDDRRLVVLLMDDRYVFDDNGRVDLSIARRTLEVARSVIDQLSPADLAAVEYAYHGDLGQDFTTDRAALRRAIDRFAPSRAAGAPRGVLTGLVAQLATLPDRRKLVLYIGDGSDLGGDVRTRDALYQAAQRANVTFYCLDAAGLAGPEVASKHPKPNLDPHGPARNSLLEIADNTGGRAIVNTNSPQRAIPDIFSENASYYLIGFEPSTPIVPGSIHRVEVKVDRPGLEVRASREFDALRNGTLATASTHATAEARPLAGPVSAPDLPLRLAAVPFASTSRSAADVALAIRVTETGVAWSTAETWQVDIRAFTPDGDPQAARTMTVRGPVRTGGNGDLDDEILSSIRLAPGRHELRISVRSAALDKVGSVFADVDVPDFAKAPISLSGVALTSSSAPPSGPTQAVAAIVPVLPTSEREFHATDHVIAYLRLYEGGRHSDIPAEMAIRVTDDHDRVVDATSKTLQPQPGTGGTAVQFELPLSRLVPGSYLLSIEAARGPDHAVRDVIFSVR